MSFRKSIQSLRALTEAPLPPLMDPKVFYPEPERDWQGNERKGYSAAPVLAKIDKVSEKEKALYGLKKLGSEGSSRVAIALRVKANEFTSEGKKTLKEYGIEPKGTIKTVIKLALNPQGIAQNATEIRAWKDTKSFMFVPVLDHSTEQKRSSVEIGGEPVPAQYSNWVQTIEVEPLNGKRDKWLQALRDTFGVGTTLVSALQIAGRTQKGFAESIKEWEKTLNLSSTQLKNLKELLRAAKISDMAMIDLTTPSNWGMIGDRLFVIDYGYDASTLAIYRDNLDIDVSVSKDGVVSVDFRGDQNLVDMAREKLQPS